MPGIPREVAEHSLDICLTPAPCNNGYAASTRSGDGLLERSCGSF
jgi:hypothetical protein